MLYEISATSDEMCEWMTAIDAAIQGVPNKAEHRMRSVSLSYRMKVWCTIVCGWIKGWSILIFENCFTLVY